MNLLITSLFIPLLFLNMSGKNSYAGFNSKQDKKPIFSIGVFADAQSGNFNPVGTRFYKSSGDKLKDAYNIFKKESVNFVINLGDLIDGDFESYKPMMEIINSSELKTYHLSGNHDYAVDIRLKKKLPVFTTSTKGYYSFAYLKYKFIFLNGNEISTYVSGNKTSIMNSVDIINAMKSKGELNAVDWNGGISNDQLEWLKGQLDNAVSSHKKVFLSCHFPVFPENVHNLLNYKEVLRLLEKYQNIISWFNGHNHEGDYGNFNMIHFITFKGMVETQSDNSFAIVDVYENKLWIRGFGREKSQILAY